MIDFVIDQFGAVKLGDKTAGGTPSYNQIIYGRNIKTGTMVGELKRYGDPGVLSASQAD